ncbi:MAG: hypothetical protein QG556_882 [Pseudomonadota bacterium]|nr:hypothetical protein [Pseudomonadota bacterium]
MSKSLPLFICFLVLTLGMPYIKVLVIYTGIIQLACANLIKNLLISMTHYFSLELPMIIFIIIAESFLPFMLTIAIEKLMKWKRITLKIHPATLAASLWLILNGSNLLIQ